MKASDIQKMEDILDHVNSFLAKLPQPVGLAFGLINMFRAMLQKHKAGQDQDEFEANIAIMLAGGQQMEDVANDWFARNPEFDPETGNRRT